MANDYLRITDSAVIVGGAYAGPHSVLVSGDSGWGVNLVSLSGTTAITTTASGPGYSANMLTAQQASYETAGGWVSGQNATLIRNSSLFRVRSYSLQCTSIADGTTGAKTSPLTSPPMTSNTQYTFTTWCRGVAVDRSYQLSISFYDAAQAGAGSYLGNVTVGSASAWTQCSVTIVSPSNAAYIRPVMQAIGCLAGEQHVFDDMQLLAGPGGYAIDKPLAGSIAITTTTVAPLSREHSVSGQIDIPTSTTGAETVARPLIGSISVAITTAGLIINAEPEAGLAVISASLSGTLAAVRPLLGAAAVTVTTDGSLVTSRPLTGTVDLAVIIGDGVAVCARSLSGGADVVIGIDALLRKMSLAGLSVDIPWDVARWYHDPEVRQMVAVDMTTAMVG